MEKTNRMETMPIPGLVARVSVPLMLSMLVQSLYNIVDGIFVSRISEKALTATSLAYAAQMLMLAVAVGTGVGINSLLARNLGKKDFEAVNKTAVNGLFLALVCSIVFMAAGFFGARTFITFFTDEEEIQLLGGAYLKICMVGCSGIFLATTGERLLQATGNTLLSMLAQMGGALVNIFLDPILIFGLFGLPAMGIEGAAAATVIGQFAAAALALGLNHVKNKEITFRFRGFLPDASIIRQIYTVGIPTILTQMMGSIMMMAMNLILIGFSGVMVAFFGVYYKLWTFLYMPVSGLAQGQIPIAGYNYGAKNVKRTMDTFKVTMAVDLTVMLIGTVVFQLFPQQLLGLYKAGEEMCRIGAGAMRIMSLTFPLASVTITAGFFCSALGNGIVSMTGTFLRQLFLLIPAAYLFARFFGEGAVWYAFWLSEGVAMIYAIFHFRYVCRRKLDTLRE